MFWAPWLDVPLGERQSGLLTPEYQDGNIRLPVFVTLGDRADVTLSPGYILRGKEAEGVRGPWLGTEFRYAPSASIQGVLQLNLVYDTYRPRLTPEHAAPLADSGERGLRAVGSWQHQQHLGGLWRAGAGIAFVSDGFLIRDTRVSVRERDQDYLRSTASISFTPEDQYAGLHLLLRQDLRNGYGFFEGPSLVHRLPSIVYTLLERPLFGPVSTSFAVDFTRFAPRSRIEKRTEARDRLQLMPRLSASFLLGNAARLTSFVALRQAVALGESTGEFTQHGYPLLGLDMESELSGKWGAAIRHRIQPSLQLRYVPTTWGAPGLVDDELDAAMPTTPRRLHAALELRQLWQLRESNGMTQPIQFDVGQNMDLIAQTAEDFWGDPYGKLAVAFSNFSAQVVAFFNWFERTWIQLSAQTRWTLSFAEVRFGYDGLRGEGSDRMRRVMDSLVGPPPSSADSELRDRIWFGAGTHRASGFNFSYDALFDRRFSNQFMSPTEHRLAVSFTPNCNCWRVDAYVAQERVNPEIPVCVSGETCGVLTQPKIGVTFSLKDIGSIGSDGYKLGLRPNS